MVWFSAILLVLAVCFLRGVEDVAPYNEWGNSVRRHIVCSCHLFSNGRFNISLRFMAHLLRKYVIARNIVRSFIRFRTNRRSLTNLGRGGAMFAKQTCHGAKRSMLASRRKVVRAVFRLRTNEWSLSISVGGDVLDAPQRCLHYLSASTVVRTYPKAPSGRELARSD